MGEEIAVTEHKKKNKFHASLVIIIVMTCVSLIEMLIYLLTQITEQRWLIIFGVSFSFAIFIFLLIWFICLMVKRNNFYGVTIVFVGILALSWLVSAFPIFISVMSTCAGGVKSRINFTYAFGVINLDAYFGGNRLDLWLPYTNLMVCGLLLIIIPCLFSNVQIELKNAANAAVIEDGGLNNANPKKPELPKNRFRLSLIICIVVFAFTIFGFSLIMTWRMTEDVIFEITIIVYLAILIIVMIPLHKRVNVLAFIFASIFIVMLVISCVAVASLSSNTFWNGETYDSQLAFYGLFFKSTYSGYLWDGTWNVNEHTVPYIDLVVTAFSVIITSILFAQDRKKILKLKRESSELHE